MVSSRESRCSITVSVTVIFQSQVSTRPTTRGIDWILNATISIKSLKVVCCGFYQKYNRKKERLCSPTQVQRVSLFFSTVRSVINDRRVALRQRVLATYRPAVRCAEECEKVLIPDQVAMLS